MGMFQNLFGGSRSANIKTLIEKGALLVDVREPAEFAVSTAKGAVNIPLGTVATQLEKFRGNENIIVFCRSGNRSGQAKAILEQNGFKHVTNGGSWEEVNQSFK